jgi:hypothetical protein
VQHRERLDGNGYSRGLSGGAISPAARVLGTAGAYRSISSKQIAERLVITPKTAANHVEHIYAKIRRLQPGGRGDVRSSARAALRGDDHHNRGTMTLEDDIDAVTARARTAAQVPQARNEHTVAYRRDHLVLVRFVAIEP